MFKEYIFNINGFTTKAKYTTENINTIFLPLLNKLQQLRKAKGKRLIVVVAAPPAVGKSTLVAFLEYLSKQLEQKYQIQSVGLDGFHYKQDYLETHYTYVEDKLIKLSSVKGCPESFNVKQFLKKLELLKIQNTMWPIYDRTIHDSIDDKILIDKDIILIEGNWLLLKENNWNEIKQLADYSMFITCDKQILKKRLISRKMKGGYSKTQAESFYKVSEEKNIDRILNNSHRGELEMYYDGIKFLKVKGELLNEQS